MSRQTTLGDEESGGENDRRTDDSWSGETTRASSVAPAMDGRNCLSFTVSGPWAHFRRVDGNTVKATYRLPPRTTVAGLLAAVVGRDRDSYYETFAPGESAVAVQPTSDLRTHNLPENSLTTASEGLKSVNARGKVSIRYPDPTYDRQRSNYEVLVDPAYRIDVWTADESFYDTLRDRLSSGESHYAPSLGLSEHLAEIEYHGEFTVTRHDGDGPTAVDSAVPDPDGVVPDPDVSFGTERSPGYMERTNGAGEFPGRRTTGYLTHAYPLSPGDGDGDEDENPLPRLTVAGATVHEVDGRRVVFA